MLKPRFALRAPLALALLIAVAPTFWARSDTSFGAAAATAATTTGAAFPAPALDEPKARGTETAVLAGGCFWGTEGVFESLRGVSHVYAGYSGGAAETAHYDDVSTGTTGHAESVKIVFDPSKITYGTLLRVYFSVAHDPTELNRQGPDDGTQYRSTIFFANDTQRKIASAYIAQLDAAHVFPQKIVTTVVPLKGFYMAEAYHQQFLRLHPDYPYIAYNDLPKLAKLKHDFPALATSETDLASSR
jgi:peptide-methionine (S)-S-oxide reductase